MWKNKNFQALLVEYKMVLPLQKTIAESLGKLPQDIAALASILCDQAACRGFELTLRSPPNSCSR